MLKYALGNGSEATTDMRHLPCLALDGLNQESCRVLSVQLQRAFKIRDLPIADRAGRTPIFKFRANGSEVGSKTSAALRIGTHAAWTQIKISIRKVTFHFRFKGLLKQMQTVNYEHT